MPNREQRSQPVMNLDIANIQPWPDQPRKYFDPKKITALARSIDSIGQLEPVKVKKIPGTKGKYILIDGERRLRAIKELGKARIRATVEPVQTDEEQFKKSLASNFCREGHSVGETARALAKIVDSASNMARYKAVTMAAEICGKSDTWVYNHLDFLKLEPSAFKALEDGKLGFPVAVAMKKLSPHRQRTLTSTIIKRKMGTAGAMSLISHIRSLSPRTAMKGRPERTARTWMEQFKHTAVHYDRLAGTPRRAFLEIIRTEAFEAREAIGYLMDIRDGADVLITGIRRNMPEKKQAAA